MKRMIAGSILTGVVLSIAFFTKFPQDDLVRRHNFNKEKALSAELYEQRAYHWKAVISIEKRMTPEQLDKRGQTSTEHYIEALITEVGKHWFWYSALLALMGYGWCWAITKEKEKPEPTDEITPFRQLVMEEHSKINLGDLPFDV